MKKIICLLLLFLSISMDAQNFEKNWEKVYQFEYDGKIKSASEVATKIYKKARKQNNEFEIVRTFIYQSKYLQLLEEEAQFKIIANLQKELQTKNSVSKSLFHYIYAKLLFEYQQVNHQSLHQNSNTDSIYCDDFRTWTYSNFTKEINNSLEQSIKNDQVLLATPLKNYENLFIYTVDKQDINLSLYDFLASEYMNSIYDNSRNEYNFITKNSKKLYGNISDFQSLKLDSIYDTNLQKKLSIYQKLERSYASSNNDLALAHTILKRITSIYKINPQAKEYLNSLERFANQFNNKLKGAFQIEMATIYNDQAYNHTYTDLNVKALALTETILHADQEPYSTRAKRLKQDILQQKVSIKTQRNVVPNQANRALIDFKNVDTIYGAFYRISSEMAFENYPDDYDSYKK